MDDESFLDKERTSSILLNFGTTEPFHLNTPPLQADSFYLRGAASRDSSSDFFCERRPEHGTRADAKTSDVESTSRQDNEANEYIPNSALTTNKRRARKPTKFNRFPKLPTELRYRIWSLALPDARVIETLWNSESNKYYTDAPQPTILRVNKESRGEALRFYEAWVVNVRKEPLATPCRLTRSASAKKKQYEEEQSKQNTPILFGTYVNFSTDTVYFSSHYLNDRPLAEYLNSFARFILSKQSSKLKLLVVQGKRHYQSTNNTTLWLFAMVSYMIRFGAAQKLLYVVNDDCCDSDGLTMHGRAFRVEEVKDESLDKTVGWLKRSFMKIMEVRRETIPELFRHIQIHLDIVPARITMERARRKK